MRERSTYTRSASVKLTPPNEVAESGRPLQLVKEPPPRTLAGVPAPAKGVELEFTTVMQPYGVDSDGGLVVRLGRVTPVEGADASSAKYADQLTGQNVVLVMTPQTGGGVGGGGTYQITFGVREIDGGGRLVLISADRKQD